MKVRGSVQFVKLLGYCYEGAKAQTNDVGEMRDMVLEFAAIWAKSLLDCKDFQELIKEGGLIALHLADMQAKRFV